MQAMQLGVLMHASGSHVVHLRKQLLDMPSRRPGSTDLRDLQTLHAKRKI